MGQLGQTRLPVFTPYCPGAQTAQEGLSRSEENFPTGHDLQPPERVGQYLPFAQAEEPHSTLATEPGRHSASTASTAQHPAPMGTAEM